ncbi:hypothetical protein [Myxosarcina sp. GI1]|uniref:hypothetical protein n=1 Tax=Myxosarcina sp. GI1 TaxID=1541065 RepID=UPI00055C5CAB|nr:hypothetical protein [Myxosarcina sp. GI1]
MSRQLIRRSAFVILALALIAFLSPANAWWRQWYLLLQGELFKLLFDVGRIILISMTIAGLLAPFEALGWWAGWYGEERDLPLPEISTDSASTIEFKPISNKINHYVVYLDGIGKSSFDYSFRVEKFLERLQESLPSDRLLIRDIIPYSVNNLPLTIGRPLAAIWRKIESIARLEVLILLRNMFQVAVSVDRRYGPIYNRGAAEVIIESLLSRGYKPGSGVLVTLIGYSGGGQISLGSVPYLKKVLAAPIEVICLAGVISGNTEVVRLEHLYYLAGKKDRVARLTPYLFPQRWSLFSWSNWNLAKSRGEISFISLGDVGHDSKNGPLDEEAILLDGRNHLEQTLDIVTRILTRKDGKEPFPAAVPELAPNKPQVTSNYERYLQAAFNHPSYYPIEPTISANYLPVGNWLGRLILPQVEERSKVKGVYFEVHHAPNSDRDLIGQTVYLRWSDRPDLQAYVNQVKVGIDFSEQAYESIAQGIVHPTRLNHWRQVQPLESLAGARPNDDVMVSLGQAVEVNREATITSLYISREPIVITGKFFALVSIGEAVEPDLYQVRHYNRASKQFDGREETIYLPQVIADRRGVLPATTNKIERSSSNASGWYIYGAKNAEGMFTVRAIAPRALFQLQPQKIITGRRRSFSYIRDCYWQGAKNKQGQIDSILLNPQNLDPEKLISSYQEGDRLLVLHTFGGIGGNKKEFAPLGIFFGHFAFGLARVVRDPFSRELTFKITYSQVYTQNTAGIIAGNLDWTNYMGDRQFGWLGTRPITDIIVKLDILDEYNFGGLRRFPLNALVYQLDKMMARYRTGDGTGATFVGMANSCVQDSFQALHQAINMTMSEIERNAQIQDWIKANPQDPQTLRLERLFAFNQSLRNKLIPWQVRSDWVDSTQSLIGTRLEDRPITTIINASTSWRSLLPRLANDRLAEIFLQHGATLWLLQTFQVGGKNEDIAPIVPTKLWI